MSRRVMHATDFSPASRAAFTKAIELAKRDRAPLTITHVMLPPLMMMGDGYVAPSTWDQISRAHREMNQKKLDALVARAKSAGVRAQGLLLEGQPAERILRAARGAGLLVIGTHGRTGLARFILGSVASRIVAGARCPVVTVRGK
ncbi:MAG TPA: universal stress protein [Methylomirabilota bacterium]|nr:universal stress protein [Methylomirabilota bacterium]